MSSSNAPKRALPSWMSARDDESRKKRVNNEESGSGKKSTPGSSGASDFSKLLDGVVFVLSGFVNPERGTLRSQALEMGAEYQPDWSPNCTLLVCAFPNTPKFRQVEADGGTIVSKDWIRECYGQKKLVDIEPYLMHVGKPWRKSNISHAGNQDNERGKSHKRDKQPQVEHNSSSASKELSGDSSKHLKGKFSPSKVKKWAVDDFNKTLAWLESQEEKPEPNEIRNVAAQGVLTCLDEAIDLLGKKQDLQQLTEQWGTVPQVVHELIYIAGNSDAAFSFSNEDLHKLAVTCKKIYEGELKTMSNTSVKAKKNTENKPTNRDKGKGVQRTQDYDSDDTIEMTQEEIDSAYNSIVSTIPKS